MYGCCLRSETVSQSPLLRQCSVWSPCTVLRPNSAQGARPSSPRPRQYRTGLQHKPGAANPLLVSRSGVPPSRSSSSASIQPEGSERTCVSGQRSQVRREGTARPSGHCALVQGPLHAGPPAPRNPMELWAGRRVRQDDASCATSHSFKAEPSSKRFWACSSAVAALSPSFAPMRRTT